MWIPQRREARQRLPISHLVWSSAAPERRRQPGLANTRTDGHAAGRRLVHGSALRDVERWSGDRAGSVQVNTGTAWTYDVEMNATVALGSTGWFLKQMPKPPLRRGR